MFSVVKPNIQVFRAKFSEITPNSIRRACENLVEPDANISDAVDVRQELDLRIGNVAFADACENNSFTIIEWHQFTYSRIITILSHNDSLVKC